MININTLVDGVCLGIILLVSFQMLLNLFEASLMDYKPMMSILEIVVS